MPSSSRRATTSSGARAPTSSILGSPGDIVPTVIEGGEWIVSHPASCRVTYHVGYLPTHADAEGWGARSRARSPSTSNRLPIGRLADREPAGDRVGAEVPSAEVSADEPIVAALVGASTDVGRPARVGGLDNWHDGATFTRFGGTPCVCFSPGGNETAHMIDESVPVNDVVACAQALAVAAIRFGG